MTRMPPAAYHGVPIEVGDVFRAPVDGEDSDYTFQEVDAYAFTEKTGNTTVNLTLSGTVGECCKSIRWCDRYICKIKSKLQVKVAQLTLTLLLLQVKIRIIKRL